MFNIKNVIHAYLTKGWNFALGKVPFKLALIKGLVSPQTGRSEVINHPIFLLINFYKTLISLIYKLNFLFYFIQILVPHRAAALKDFYVPSLKIIIGIQSSEFSPSAVHMKTFLILCGPEH